MDIRLPNHCLNHGYSFAKSLLKSWIFICQGSVHKSWIFICQGFQYNSYHLVAKISINTRIRYSKFLKVKGQDLYVIKGHYLALDVDIYPRKCLFSY